MGARQDPPAGLRRLRLAELLPEPLSHYCDAVEVDGWVYVSGLLALTPDGTLVGKGDAQLQARTILSVLGQMLGAAAASLDDVVKVTVYVVDMDDRVPINVEREAAFGPSRPASTLVEVSRLAHPDALVEIDCVARVPQRGRSA